MHVVAPGEEEAFLARFALADLPFVGPKFQHRLARLGMRTVLFLGTVAYVARYGIWSMTDLPVSVLVASQALHGVCYAFFFAAAYILVERIAPEDVRNSAQTVFGILILGLGPVIGGQLSGWLQERYTRGDAVDYGNLWLTLSAIALVTAIGLFFAFRDSEAETG